MKIVGLALLMTSVLNAHLASAGCMPCADGHITCHDSGGVPECGAEAPPNSKLSSSRIVCGSGAKAAKIIFQGSVLELPLGSNSVELENFATPLSPVAEISINPIFHYRQIGISTAYCSYNINVDSVSGNPYVLNASMTCEGQPNQIQCQFE